MQTTCSTTSDITALWREYKATGAVALRNRLVEHYRPLLPTIIDVMQNRLVNEADADEIESSAALGLIRAVEGFDPARGWKFETYANPRIRGAILDGIRAMDRVPRKVRERVRLVRSLAETLTQQLGRPPTPEEIVSRIDVPANELSAIVRDSRVIETISMQEIICETNGERFERGHAITDDSADDPAALAELNDLVAVIVRAFTPMEAMIVTFYYFHGLTFKQIGKRCSRNESTVLYWLKGAMTRVRRILEAEAA